jgi:hypothetical protein
MREVGAPAIISGGRTSQEASAFQAKLAETSPLTSANLSAYFFYVNLIVPFPAFSEKFALPLSAMSHTVASHIKMPRQRESVSALKERERAPEA